MLVTAEEAGIRDLRSIYRAAVCERLEAQGRGCDNLLLRLPGEGAATNTLGARDLPTRYRIAFVPGFLANCFARIAQPFEDVRSSLQDEGFQVDYLSVAGRGTSSANAAELARELDARADDPRPYIVFAYSKGLPDVLELLVQYPQLAERSVAAIVAVAGVASGSPLADRLEELYRRLATKFPLPDCKTGDGDEIRDLRRDVRLEWWRRHGRALKTPIFSVVAAPRPERVSAIMRTSYDWLAKLDPHNDGRLLWSDQVAPRSYLLGYVNADHYAVAMPLSRALPALSFAFVDDLPRAVLVRAGIDVVAAALGTGPSSGR